MQQGLQTEYSQGGRELRRVNLSWMQLLLQLHDSLRNAPLVTSPFRDRDPRSSPPASGGSMAFASGRLASAASDLPRGTSGQQQSSGYMAAAASAQLPLDHREASLAGWSPRAQGASRLQFSAAPSSRVYSSDLDLGLRAALTEMSLRRSSEAQRNVHQPTRYFRDFGNSSGVLHGAYAHTRNVSIRKLTSDSVR